MTDPRDDDDREHRIKRAVHGYDDEHRNTTRAAVAVTVLWISVLGWLAVFGLGRWAGIW